MFTSFKPSFKKTWFFCSLSLPSVFQPVRKHSGQNLELCPSFPKSGKASHLSSWLIHLAGSSDLKIALFHQHSLALFATSCSLFAAGQSSPLVHRASKRRDAEQVLSNLNTLALLSSLTLPTWSWRTVLISLESCYEWLTLILKQWNVVYKLLGSNI